MRPAPLAPGVKQMLRDTLAEDVTKLSNLLQRDLSHWLTELQCGTGNGIR